MSVWSQRRCSTQASCTAGRASLCLAAFELKVGVMLKSWSKEVSQSPFRATKHSAVLRRIETLASTCPCSSSAVLPFQCDSARCCRFFNWSYFIFPKFCCCCFFPVCVIWFPKCTIRQRKRHSVQSHHILTRWEMIGGFILKSCDSVLPGYPNRCQWRQHVDPLVDHRRIFWPVLSSAVVGSLTALVFSFPWCPLPFSLLNIALWENVSNNTN